MRFLMSSQLLAAAVVSWVGGMAIVAQRSEPPTPDSKRAHVRVYLGEAPNLRFYPEAYLSGTPAIEVNERGAFVDGTSVCTWPGGAFDASNEANMVLGYQLSPAGGGGVGMYEPCPDGFPIVSTWAGFGGAALYIEVFARKGLRIEVRFRGRSYYMDLRSLPGTPCPTAWSCGLSERKVYTWYWQMSEAESTRHALRSASQLRRDPAFSAFMKNVVRCVTSSRASNCFSAFVQGPLGYSDVNPGVYDMTAQQFTEAAWSRTNLDGRPFSEHLTACFVQGELDAEAGARSAGATLTTTEGWTCDLQKTSKGWRLVRFFQNPDVPVPTNTRMEPTAGS